MSSSSSLLANLSAAEQAAVRFAAAKLKRTLASPENIRARFKAEYNEKLHFLLDHYQYKVAWSGRYASKCLAFGTKVIMWDGRLRNVENVLVGDKVMGPDSLPRTVLNTTSGFGPLYRVDQSQGMSYVVNENHILALKKSDRRTGFIEKMFIGVTVFASQTVEWRDQFRGYRARQPDLSQLNVTRAPDGEWAGFTLDGDHLFLLEDGTVTHNSWAYAGAILALGLERPLRVVCLRETMKSLEDSVHALMEDQVKRLGLTSHYQVRQSDILSKNGTEIFYAGLHNNVANIKSMEGCDIFWVEEAQGVSQESWETLLPTVRKPGAELWVSMNPRFAEDDSYKRWITNPPPGAKVVFLSYRDNKYITPDMQSKMDHLESTDPDMFDHVYEGACLSTVEDAIYKDVINAAEKNGQFRSINYDARRAVDVVFDLGWGDMVSMWFVQNFPFQVRLVNYYENTHQNMDHYLHTIQGMGYTIGDLIFPWDGGVKHVSNGKSAQDVARSKGFRTRVLRRGSIHDRIDAVRTTFPQLYFDANKCAKGIAHLRRYQWGPPNADGKLKREPLHDAASHSSDCLGYVVLSLKDTPNKSASGATPAHRYGGSLAGLR